MILSSRPYRLLIAGVLIVVLTCWASFWLITREQQRLHNEELTRQLLTEARMIRESIRGQWPDVPAGSIAGLVHTLQRDGVHIALVGADGTRFLDSTGTLEPGELLGTPEVRGALLDSSGTDQRDWGPDHRAHVMVAVRVGSDDSTHGVVWLSRPVWTITEHPTAYGRLLGIGGGIAALVTLILVGFYLRLHRRVLGRVVETARNLSAGDLATELDVSGADELAVLSSSLNALRERLAWQVETIDRQRQMLQALIDQSHEGIIVTRADGCIALINPSAIRLLNLPLPAAGGSRLVGRQVEHCIPQRGLRRLLLGGNSNEPDPGGQTGGPSKSKGRGQEEIELRVETRAGTVHLLARASALVLVESEKASGAPPLGRVAVLTDITELQHTIQVRTDFVANASHELRTPLSTIRAAAETLLTMDLRTETEQALEFLEKVDRQSARLQQMVADLLDLSRLESPTEQFEPEALEPCRVVMELQNRFAEALERKRLEWQVDGDVDDNVTIRANPRLLRLVLDNLVDNAIKFTEPEGRIHLHMTRTDELAVFQVSDSGCGIPEEEQQRVFERFYQVQRSRSGPERGTGLGLSIVRHAVGAMGGSVQLESKVGEGTRVTVSIPQKRRPTVKGGPPEESSIARSHRKSL
ncbi:MAG: HAMP domain-containing protein [Phycisphaerae bacterium]|nr:HAMP domain-containing protein [Phycisphaerae bacterium]